jgi:predicted nuclease of predicted toxin-antitoxin system
VISVVVDMNLPPSWAGRFAAAGFQAIHWSTIGAGNATDATVMKWAADRGHVLVTQDLDFPALLASNQAKAPSVIVIRAPDVLAEPLLERVIQVLSGLQDELQRGAIVTIDAERSRLRVLPL